MTEQEEYHLLALCAARQAERLGQEEIGAHLRKIAKIILQNAPMRAALSLH